MRNLTCLLGSCAIAMLLGSSGALAAKCEGSNARTYAAPITLHKAQDGAALLFIESTGTSFTSRGDASALNPSWQRCVGFWSVKADKSGAGAGHCYAVDPDGDRWTISWEGDNAGGTWQSVSGSGKYANAADGKGTWTPGPKFAGGISINTWEGECPE